MKKFNIFLFFALLSGAAMLCSAEQNSLPPELKTAALKDAACTAPADAKETEPTLAGLPIRSGGREVGSIVLLQGPCHCRANNCDALVYLRNGQEYRLALHKKYASLHPMKIVKRGMPSLTGQFDLSPLKMETTVYDWDGRDYRPSLCATVTKGKRVPAIARHPCKPPEQ